MQKLRKTLVYIPRKQNFKQKTAIRSLDESLLVDLKNSMEAIDAQLDNKLDQNLWESTPKKRQLSFSIATYYQRMKNYLLTLCLIKNN